MNFVTFHVLMNRRDTDIARVIALQKVGHKLTKRQIGKESQYVRKLLLYD